MRPLRVQINVTNGTATPAQPDPRTVHLNVAQQQRKGDIAAKCRSPAIARPATRNLSEAAVCQPLPSPPQDIAPPAATPHTANRARLLQTAEIPAETARLVCCHNPWPTEDVHFCPGDAIPAFVTRIPALSSGPKSWIAIHNHRPELLRLHSGQNIGVLDRAHRRPLNSDQCTTSRARASLTAPAATAERPLQGVQRRVQPRRGRPRLYSAAGACHRDARASTSPNLPASKPSCSTGGDGVGPANAGQRRHPPLQQSLRFTGSNGEEKRW